MSRSVVEPCKSVSQTVSMSLSLFLDPSELSASFRKINPLVGMPLRVHNT